MITVTSNRKKVTFTSIYQWSIFFSKVQLPTPRSLHTTDIPQVLRDQQGRPCLYEFCLLHGWTCPSRCSVRDRWIVDRCGMSRHRACRRLNGAPVEPFVVVHGICFVWTGFDVREPLHHRTIHSCPEGTSGTVWYNNTAAFGVLGCAASSVLAWNFASVARW